MTAAMFMNSNSLPIALMQRLVVSVPDLAWGSTHNTDALRICNRITLSPLNYETTYLSISQILASYNLNRVVSWPTPSALLWPRICCKTQHSQQVIVTLLVDSITFLLHRPSVTYN
jgi:hypothetical protein